MKEITQLLPIASDKRVMPTTEYDQAVVDEARDQERETQTREPANKDGAAPATVDRLVANAVAGPSSLRPGLELVENHLDAGAMRVGQTSVKRVSFINREAEPIALQDPIVTGSPSVTAKLVGTATIAPGDYGVVEVSVAPRNAGALQALVHLVARDGAAVMLRVSASVTPGAPSPDDIVYGPRQIRPFMEQQPLLRWGWPASKLEVLAEVGTVRTVRLDLWNDGTRPISTLATLTGASSMRVIDPPTSVGAQSRAAVQIQFAPTREEIVRGAISITTSQGERLVMELHGEGTAKSKSPDPHPARVIEQEQERPPVIDNSKNRWKLALPSKLELGDTLVGTKALSPFSIFALERAQGPRVRARLVGDSSIKLVRAPLFLPGAGATYEESTAFLLEYAPSRSGRVSSILEMDILDAPHETFRVAVTGKAHERGEHMIDDQDAELRERDNARKRDARSKEFRKEQAELGARRGTANRFTPEDLRDFNRARDNAKDALEDVFSSRLEGVREASAEIGSFIRRDPPPEQPDRVERLAWKAIDLASAAVAAFVSKRAEPLVQALLTTRQPRAPSLQNPAEESLAGPGAPIVVAFTDALKHIVKTTLKKSDSKPAPKGPTPVDDSGATGVGASDETTSYALASTRAEAAYISLQATSLIDKRRSQVNDVVDPAYDALWPTFHTAPTTAITAMRALAESLKPDVQAMKAVQSEQSVRRWVEYVAETAGLDRATRSFSKEAPLAHQDGLIDLRVRADQRTPTERVKIVGARLDGVTTAVVRRLKQQPLGNLGLPVRVSTDFGSQGMSMTVTKRSTGAIDFAEDTTRRGHAPWLERKAASYGRGADAVAGARMLMEREVLPETLHGIPVENDSAEPDNSRKG